MTLLGAHTDAGVAKPVDQDAYCFKEAETGGCRAVMAVVCDGVGGLSKGELASSTVVRRFSDWFETSLPTFLAYNLHEGRLDWEALRNVWETLLQSANRHVFEYGARTEEACGTTFTGMFAYDDAYLIAHVGDCRAYEVTEREALQLTRDQTLVAQQVSAGILTSEEAAHHPKRNVIMQSVGTQDEVNPVFTQGTFDATATYVLCCDGFYSRLRDGEMQNAFSSCSIADEQDMQKACEELVRMDMERGEKDNITVVAFSARCGTTGANGEDARNGVCDEDAASTTLLSDVDEDRTPTTIVQGGGLR